MGRWDELAWYTIRNRTRAMVPTRGLEQGGRPRDLYEVELLMREGESFEDGFETGLQEFYRYSDVSFLAVRPQSSFLKDIGHGWRELPKGFRINSGSLSQIGVNDPGFVSDEIWDSERERLLVSSSPANWLRMLEERLQRSDPEFRSRRVIAKLRSLSRVRGSCLD